MAPYHARSSVAHHLTNPLSHLFLVAMHGASCASRFFGAEWASFGAFANVVPELFAGFAKARVFSVMIAAVNSDHRANGGEFAGKMSGVRRFHHGGGCRALGGLRL